MAAWPFTTRRAWTIPQPTSAAAPLSGVNDRSIPFFRTVAASPALVARAREIASDLQRILAAELARDPTFEGDGTLLAAFFIAGYGTVLVETARHLIAGEPLSAAVVDDHRTRFERLFDALRSGVVPGREGREAPSTAKPS